jgi:hypothetical protein
MTAQTTIDIRPVERNKKHYVVVIMDGLKMHQRGPYFSADKAAAVAERLLRFSRALTSSRTAWR